MRRWLGAAAGMSALAVLSACNSPKDALDPATVAPTEQSNALAQAEGTDAGAPAIAPAPAAPTPLSPQAAAIVAKTRVQFAPHRRHTRRGCHAIDRKARRARPRPRHHARRQHRHHPAQHHHARLLLGDDRRRQHHGRLCLGRLRSIGHAAAPHQRPAERGLDGHRRRLADGRAHDHAGNRRFHNRPAGRLARHTPKLMHDPGPQVPIGKKREPIEDQIIVTKSFSMRKMEPCADAS